MASDIAEAGRKALLAEARENAARPIRERSYYNCEGLLRKYPLELSNRDLADAAGEVKKVTGGDDYSGSEEDRTALPYGLPSECKGDGQCIGILEFGGAIEEADLPMIFASKHVANAAVVKATPFHVAENSVRFEHEVKLDAQLLARYVPQARKVFYLMPDNEAGWIAGLKYILADAVNAPKVLSISWGYFEQADGGASGSYWSAAGIAEMEALFARAALLGITVCCCSGDEGVGMSASTGGPRVYYPASSEFVLACGGTMMQGGEERAWCSAKAATGGGISDVIPMPPWQKESGIQVAGSGVHRAAGALRGRMIPDVAAAAVARVRGIGGSATVSGTSAAAPLWAALIAMANQRMQEAGIGKTAGNFTPLLYGNGSGLRDACTDIRQGRNAIPCSNSVYYQAAEGWDVCTGWGTPRAVEFVAALVRSASDR